MQSLNAHGPIYVTVLGIAIFEMPVFEKAPAPIVVKYGGREISFNAEQLKKAPSLMLVTLLLKHKHRYK